MKVPLTLGVPLIVATLPNHEPVTPFGNPLNDASVAPTVEYVIVVIAVLIHFVCESVPTAELKAIVLFGVTVMVAVPLCACEHEFASCLVS